MPVIANETIPCRACKGEHPDQCGVCGKRLDDGSLSACEGSWCRSCTETLYPGLPPVDGIYTGPLMSVEVKRLNLTEDDKHMLAWATVYLLGSGRDTLRMLSVLGQLWAEKERLERLERITRSPSLLVVDACACGGEVWAYDEDGTPKCEEHAV